MSHEKLSFCDLNAFLFLSFLAVITIIMYEFCKFSAIFRSMIRIFTKLCKFEVKNKLKSTSF